jgi:hypothetical protein
MRIQAIAAILTAALILAPDDANAGRRVFDNGLDACSVDFVAGPVPSDGGVEVAIGTHDPNVFDSEFRQCDPSTFDGFSIKIGDDLFDTLYVNENGIVSFGGLVTSPAGTALADIGLPVFAPFFADGQIVDQDSLVYGYTREQDAFGVNSFWLTWASFFPEGDPTADPNIFQMVIVDQGNGDFDLIFNYDTIAWDGDDAQAGFYTDVGSQILLAGAGIAGAYQGEADEFTQACFPGFAATALACNSRNDGTGLASRDLFDPNIVLNGYYLFQFRDGVFVDGVQEVPLPPAVFLAAIGLLGLSRISRKR